MNKQLWLLKSYTQEYASFIEEYSQTQESIMARARNQNWKPFDDSYKPIQLELDRSDSGKKNYQFDISCSLAPFFIISEKMLDKLSDILEPRGQILPVITKSKRKKFFGYYLTDSLSNCLDMDNSIYQKYPNGIRIDKPVLISGNITDNYIFSIKESYSDVYITDAFKTRVEDAGLVGFDFSKAITVT